MPVYALTGNDTIQVGGRTLKNFGNGDVAKITFANDLVDVAVGKNGNAVFNGKASGGMGELELRVIRGSADDTFLNTELTKARADLPSYIVLDGYFVKRIGDGKGNVTNDTYLGSGGIVAKLPEAAENTEGATDPGLSIYKVKFANFKRANM